MLSKSHSQSHNVWNKFITEKRINTHSLEIKVVDYIALVACQNSTSLPTLTHITYICGSSFCLSQFLELKCKYCHKEHIRPSKGPYTAFYSVFSNALIEFGSLTLVDG